MKLYAIVAATLAVIALIWWLDRNGYQRAIRERDVAIARSAAQQAEAVIRVNDLREKLRTDNERFSKRLADVSAAGKCRPVDPDLRRLLDD